LFTIKKLILILPFILSVLFLVACNNDTNSNDANGSNSNGDVVDESNGEAYPVGGDGSDENDEDDGDDSNSDSDVAEGYSAFELLEHANVETSALDGMVLEFSTETVTPILGIEDHDISMEIIMTGTMESVPSGDSFEASTEIEQDFMGSLTTFNAYFRDDTIYVDLREEHNIGMKTEIEVSNVFALINIHTDFAESNILEESVEVIDGERTLLFSLDEDALLDVVNGQLNIGELTSDYLGDFTYTMAVVIDDDSVIQSIVVEIDFVYEIEEQESDMSMNSQLEVASDSSVTIEFPEGLDEFFLGETTIPPW